MLTENYWDPQLSELVDRRGKVNAKRRELSKDKSLNREQRDKALADLNANLFTKEELKILELGVSNAAYHYLGSAKILGQVGKAFADALASMKSVWRVSPIHICDKDETTLFIYGTDPYWTSFWLW